MNTVTVYISLIGWVFMAIALFTMMPARRAVLVAYIAAWLFLPQASIPMKGIPDLDKITATSLGAIMGVLLFDAGRLMSLRPSWVDLPMALWVVSFVPSALLNDPGPDGTPQWYDALSGVLKDVLTWGLPYLVGRMYFTDLQGLRELAIGIVLGGLVYVPLCLFEIRMSPQLHNIVYGYHPTPFAMTIRFSGYRPMVFMQHGLMVGMWMTCATLAAAWLWSTGAVKQLLRIPMGVLVVVLFGVTVLCKSTGALALLLVGLGVLYATKYLRVRLVLIGLLALTPLYMTARTQKWWSGEGLVEFAESIDEERAESLAGRLENEDLIIAKAQQRPWFGWGGWGRWRVVDEWTGKDITVADGMWVIVRGERGLVGLVLITLVLLLPFALLLRRVPARFWAHPAFAAPTALATLLVLFSIDSLLNAMLNPILIIGAGAISAFYVGFPRMQAMAMQQAMMTQTGVPTVHLPRAKPAMSAPGARFRMNMDADA